MKARRPYAVPRVRAGDRRALARRRLLKIIFDSRAASCCYLPGKSLAEPAIMSGRMFQQVLAFARRGNYEVALLHCGTARARRAVRGTIGIIPYSYVAGQRGEDVVVVSHSDAPFTQLRSGSIVVYLLDRWSIGHLSADVRLLLTLQTARICLIHSDLPEWSEGEMGRYSKAIRVVRRDLDRRIPLSPLALNVLTDALFLQRPNHCNAGIQSLAVGPDGQLYVCPSFYLLGPSCTVGSIEKGLSIRNPELLTLDRAPICLRCRAFHCPRCVFLNKRRTDEINTPSRAQCVVAHLEQAESRSLTQSYVLADIPVTPPSAVTSLDPLEDLLASGREEPVET